MRDESYDEAIRRRDAEIGAEADPEAIARFAGAASALLPLLSGAVDGLTALAENPPTREQFEEADRHLTLELLKRGLIQ